MELNRLSVFPGVESVDKKKTRTDILAGDRVHVGALGYAFKVADPSARLKLGL